jgi:flagellar biosynthetic protein FliO
LTEQLDEPLIENTFALRLNEALEAINAVSAVSQSAASDPAPAPKRGLRAWLASLDKLPPIRLPIGLAIPWRLGLPALLVIVVAMGIMTRSTAQADSTGVQLPPAQQTYPIQREAPLFAQPVEAPAPTAQPIGVPEPAATAGFDLMDIGIKLVAVLGLAYGSLMLLKRFGYGGAASRGTTSGQSIRVVSSIALAPNRSVHVIEVPGGKTLLVGATPTSVNLLTELDPAATLLDD